MRMASLIAETKILPSPIFPVRVAVMMAWTAFSSSSSGITVHAFDADGKQGIFDGVEF
jgi:hypothetical protein